MGKLLRGPQLFVSALVIGLLFFAGQLPRTSDEPRRSTPTIGSSTTLLTAYASWELHATGNGSADALVLPLTWSKGLSSRFTEAAGRARLDLRRGELEVSVRGLERGAHDVWLVDERTVDRGPGGRRTSAHALRLGRLSPTNGGHALGLDLAGYDLAGVDLDFLVVAPAGADPRSEGLLFGSPSLFQKIYYRTRVNGGAPEDAGLARAARPLDWSFLVPAPAYAASAASQSSLDSLIAAGEALFFGETFDGNGRTCGTCHPAENNFTIDPDWIATLPPTDPLFVAENDTALAELENSVLMRQFGLILENVDGFEDPTNKFVMRGVPHVLSMATSIASGDSTPPVDHLGWGADGAPSPGRLRDFAIGAVRQHFTKSLNRVEGVDFRFPTTEEMDALEAFMLSLGRSQDMDFGNLKLRNAVADSGRVLFITLDTAGGSRPAGKCDLCHRNGGGLSLLMPGVNQNFDTGIENRSHPAQGTGEPMPNDGGFGTAFDSTESRFGDGTFNSTPVIESADTPPFFHNNIDTDLRVAVAFYATSSFVQSPAGQLLVSIDSGNIAINVGPDEITAFLRVINALENIRGVIDLQRRAQSAPDFAAAQKLLDLSRFDIEDASMVLTDGSLHPEAVAHLDAADSLVQAARNEPLPFERIAFIEEAIAQEFAARDSMLFPSVTDAGDPVARASLALHQNVPNPFRNGTIIRFRTPVGGPVSLSIYDAAGRKVRALWQGTRSAGEHAIVWDGLDDHGARVASGRYYYRLLAGGQERSKSLQIVR